VLTELAQNSCGGMNSDTVKKYFETLKDVIQLVERENGHALQGNEIMNIDETGFDLCLDVANVFYLHVSFFPGQLQGRLIELIFQLLYI